MTSEFALVLSRLSLSVTLMLAVLGWRVKGSQDSKIAKLNSELDMQVHARKLSFEKKFEILCQVWDVFVELRESAFRLDPGFQKIDFASSDEQKENQLRER